MSNIDLSTLTLKDIVERYINSNQISIIDNSHAYKILIESIIFPACFVLSEDIDFLPSNGYLDNVKAYSDYIAAKNLGIHETLTSYQESGRDLYNKYKNFGVDLQSDTILNMNYNFTYLPEIGSYEVVGKYNVGTETVSTNRQKKNSIGTAQTINPF